MGFSQTHKISNISINPNFVFPYIPSFLLYVHHMILVNVKLNVSEHTRILFQCSKHYWSSCFLMTQLKRSWQYWRKFVKTSTVKPKFQAILHIYMYTKIISVTSDILTCTKGNICNGRSRISQRGRGVQRDFSEVF